jgi:hypothetical protein
MWTAWPVAAEVLGAADELEAGAGLEAELVGEPAGLVFWGVPLVGFELVQAPSARPAIVSTATSPVNRIARTRVLGCNVGVVVRKIGCRPRVIYWPTTEM